MGRGRGMSLSVLASSKIGIGVEKQRLNLSSARRVCLLFFVAVVKFVFFFFFSLFFPPGARGYRVLRCRFSLPGTRFLQSARKYEHHALSRKVPWFTRAAAPT